MSTVFRGTAFELRALRTLEANFRGMSLRRVGGKDDGGVDLIGWWDLPSFSRRLRILAQCKAERKKSAPKYVREMEGVAMVYRAGLKSLPDISVPSVQSQSEFDTEEAEQQETLLPANIIAFLLSESPFTKATLLRALKSPVPLMLLHIPPMAELDGDEPVEGTAAQDPSTNGEGLALALAGVVWNPAMRALLPGCDLRVEVGLGEDKRFGIWQGSTRL